MCLDPMSMIGMALSTASSVAQAQSQAAFVNAQNQANKDAYLISKDARKDELVRQKAFEKDAANMWKDTANDLSRDKYDEAKTAAEDQFMADVAALPSALESGTLLSGQNNASDAIKSEIAARSAKAADEARARIKALAALTGTDLTGQARATTLGNNADALGVIQSFRRGSLGVSDQEQNIAPAQVTPGSSIFADILGGVGGIMTNRGGYNAGLNGTKVASATPVYKPNTLGAYLVNG